jgi:hypothetical protein
MRGFERALVGVVCVVFATLAHTPVAAACGACMPNISVSGPLTAPTVSQDVHPIPTKIVSDGGIGGITVRFDDRIVKTLGEMHDYDGDLGPYDATPGSSLGPGPHTVTITAWDLVSEKGRTKTLSFTIVGPDLELGGDLRDLAAQPLTGDTYDVWADATDITGSGGVKSVELRLNGTRVAYTEAPCDGDDCDLDVAWDFLREEHPVGHYELTATAVDWAGNSATDSFGFDLSADRTSDPTDGAAFSALTAAGLAADDGVACARWVHLFGITGARDIGSRTLPMGIGETTVAYRDGSYVVVRCKSDGDLIEAQHVGPIGTPDGRRMVPRSRTLVSRSGDGYTTSYPVYGDPRDRRYTHTWRRDIDHLAARALPPTPGVRLAGVASVDATLADDDTSCQTGAELNYETHAWGGTPWRYYIDRSSFPIVFDTVRKRDRVQERIRDGIRAWNGGRNSCGYRRLTGFPTAMQGTTNPGGSDVDTSVIDFVENITCVDDDNPEGFIVKGCTTVETYDYVIVTEPGLKLKARSADIEFRRIYPWWPRRRHRGCTNQTDIWSMAAHEVGHVVGVDDSLATSNAWQTMYKFTEDCEFRKRNLGRSDWLGLKRISNVPE